MWVADSRADTVTRIDPTTNRKVGRPIKVGRGPQGVVGGGAVWVANFHTTRCRGSIRPPTGSWRPSRPVTGPDVALGEGGLWVPNVNDRTVVKVDPARTAWSAARSDWRRALGHRGGEGSVWVTNSGDGTLQRIDPDTMKIEDEPPKSARSPPPSRSAKARSGWRWRGGTS